ncbi:hypothetical protein [Rhizobium leguminosarum]|uniref:hypothetical protein n=1 Tax=Rhizobium leguminosarum TaxID=384 RepID=UPI00130201D9|nr:hypothetical protein [Rhizobium leguminosarum]MBB4346250.1 hypothetical protein [Rhizobium leguminosarum]MBB5262858.1 hypothetical protein [Rhizobium leguminosarum]MBB6299367.1 hypothetical protein [Rhizobium leguminosarum]MBY5482844.1 hypothetical protein [Rhizobium leguminosarum]MDX5999968.1 hypothetical protein [Rhizobium leguminosarum]
MGATRHDDPELRLHDIQILPIRAFSKPAHPGRRLSLYLVGDVLSDNGTPPK